jgi:hypothetical protein
MTLRRIGRDRSGVTLGLTCGDVVSGRISRVGADHLELHSAAPGDHPSASSYAIPLGAIAFVQRR